MGSRINPVYVGEVFARLTTIEEIEKRGTKGERIFKCRCDCGNEIFVPGYTLRRGTTKSCGCIIRETSAATGRKLAKHGKSKTPEYGIWNSMKQRCLNPSTNGYQDYGARGITVDPEWQVSFPKFLEDVGPRPEKGFQLDRIDNDKGYGPGNCRWVSVKVNNNNKRNSVWIELNGENQPLSHWLKTLKISHGTYHKRLHQGFSPVEALTHKPGGYGARQRKIQAELLPIKTIDKVLVKLPEGKNSLAEVIDQLQNLASLMPDKQIFCNTRKGVVNLYLDFN